MGKISFEQGDWFLMCLLSPREDKGTQVGTCVLADQHSRAQSLSLPNFQRLPHHPLRPKPPTQSKSQTAADFSNQALGQDSSDNRREVKPTLSDQNHQLEAKAELPQAFSNQAFDQDKSDNHCEVRARSLLRLPTLQWPDKLIKSQDI
jgi:hypothetical protein